MTRPELPPRDRERGVDPERAEPETSYTLHLGGETYPVRTWPVARALVEAGAKITGNMEAADE